jgi:hypothetical protein
VTPAPDIEELRRKYFVGLARSGAETSPETLADFTLAAAHIRFTRESHRSGSENARLVRPDAPLLPQNARSLLVRLCSTKQTDVLALAAVHALQRSGMRPHPFDFHRLEDFVVRFASLLGPAAQSWAGLVRPAKGDGAATDESVTEENFASASRGAKLAFLRTLRPSAPERARELMAAQFASEPAAGRSDFLDVLAIGLQEADLPVLNAAAADKAQSVRTKAESLLARVPGTPAYATRLAKLPDYIKIKTALITRHKTITLFGLGESAAAKLMDLFDGLRIADAARALDMSPEDLASAAAEVSGLDAIILRAAIAERRFDLAVCFEAIQEAGWLVVNLLCEALPHASPADRDTLLRTLIVPKRWDRMPEAFSFEGLYSALGEPLPLHQAQDLIASRTWRDTLAKDITPALSTKVETVAALIPRALSDGFIAETQSIAPRAALFHHFLLTLPETGKP